MVGIRAPFRMKGFGIAVSGGKQGISVTADDCASESKEVAAGIAAIILSACTVELRGF